MREEETRRGTCGGIDSHIDEYEYLHDITRNRNAIEPKRFSNYNSSTYVRTSASVRPRRAPRAPRAHTSPGTPRRRTRRRRWMSTARIKNRRTAKMTPTYARLRLGSATDSRQHARRRSNLGKPVVVAVPATNRRVRFAASRRGISGAAERRRRREDASFRRRRARTRTRR